MAGWMAIHIMVTFFKKWIAGCSESLRVIEKK